MCEAHGTPPEAIKPPLRRARIVVWLTLFALVLVALCHRWQPDAVAALTAIPPWCWIVVGAPLILLNLRRVCRWEKLAAAGTVGMVLLTSVEQLRSVTRFVLLGGIPVASESHNQSLRVASHNCSTGSLSAAEEVVPFRPDVVLLQESPSLERVTKLAHKLFPDGSAVVWSPDCTIIARGRLIRSATPADFFVQATVAVAEGAEIEVFSVRLMPPVVRYDLWSPSCWSEHTAARIARTAQVSVIRRALEKVPGHRPVFVGGDFNAPAGDGALAKLSPTFTDAFDSAGTGWGGTVLNAVPMHRFDQLWTSAAIQPVAVWSEKSNHSDHRLVVGDFRVLVHTPETP